MASADQLIENALDDRLLGAGRHEGEPSALGDTDVARAPC